MTLKECCSKCGFPVDIKRGIVFLDSNILSYLHYEENICEECGHQKDGYTIPVVYKHLQNIMNKYIKDRKRLTNFLYKYQFLTKEERQGVCVMLPRFAKPNYVSVGTDEDDLEEQYSWNIVYFEVIKDTQLSRTMLNNIDDEKLK